MRNEPLGPRAPGDPESGIPQSAIRNPQWDALDRERILQGLGTCTVGRVLYVYDEVTSTNNLAMALGDAGAPHGTAVVAERQTRGRGRLGRAWASPPGMGVWTSVVLRPPVPASTAPAMTLVAGLAVAEAIEAEAGRAAAEAGEGAAGIVAALKWPNDVLLGGRKVAGILTELRTEDQAVAYLVVGIGINVHQGLSDFPPELAETAVSIRQATGRTLSRARLLRRVYERLEAWCQRFVGDGPGAVVAAAAARMPMLGQRVVAVAGAERWEGTAVRLDGDGALVLDLGAGRTRRVLAAEVTLDTNYQLPISNGQ